MNKFPRTHDKSQQRYPPSPGCAGNPISCSLISGRARLGGRRGCLTGFRDRRRWHQCPPESGNGWYKPGRMLLGDETLTCKATWEREVKLPWREVVPPITMIQWWVVNKKLSLLNCARGGAVLRPAGWVVGQQAHNPTEGPLASRHVTPP